MLFGILFVCAPYDIELHDISYCFCFLLYDKIARMFIVIAALFQMYLGK